MTPEAAAPITATPLPPPGQMPNEVLLAMLQNALRQPPTATGYGPR
jgi:hypothetical protein